MKGDSSCIKVDQYEIKKFVSNYDDETKEEFYSHLAVEKVEVFCRFPEVQVKKLGLVDMPGLGDTKLGDAERMIHALGEDVDFIIFIRMPKSPGNQWGEEDSKLYDIVLKTLSDKVSVKDCSVLVLNKTENNHHLCDFFERTALSHGINVKKVIKANCTDYQEANNILRYVVENLKSNLEILDKLHISRNLSH